MAEQEVNNIGKTLKDFNASEDTLMGSIPSNPPRESFVSPVGEYFGGQKAPIMSRKFDDKVENLPKRYAPFTPIVGTVGETYKVYITEGTLIWCNCSNDGKVFTYFDPVVKAGENYIEHTIADGESLLLSIPVSSDGVPGPAAEDLEFFVDSTATYDGGTHFYPEVGDYAGNAGTHVYRMLDFAVVGGAPVVTSRHCGSNLLHYDERPKMSNVTDAIVGGVDYEVLKDADPVADAIKFRTLTQKPAPGVEVIDSDSTDSIQIRRVKQRYDYPQIEVVEDAGAILITGNNAYGQLVVTDCLGISTTLLEWEDGLITTGKDDNIEVNFIAGCTDSMGGMI
jgi:hypothetical protein